MMAGESAAEVAKSVGMSRSAVFAWKAKYLASGDAGLAAKPVPGRPPKLTEQQRSELYMLIRDTDPRAHGFVPALWTRDLARQLIEARFGIAHTIARVGVIMREMGLSPQRPKYRAVEQDEVRVKAWREIGFPAIRDEAAQVGARIYFGDESSVRSDHHAGTTWAPVGRTPVVAKTGDRTSVNMISAISQRGDIHFELTTGRANSLVFIDFLKKLLHDDGGRVFLVLDNCSIHTSKAVQKFVESTEGTLTLFFLPPYSPQLNPDEWVWNNVKTHRIGREGLLRTSEMYDRVHRALRRLKENPHIIRGFFRDPSLSYIGA
jgi:transposase